MTETLEDAGYKVHAATSGRDGLVLHDQHATSISLTIVDLIMPDVRITSYNVCYTKLLR